MVGNGAVDGTTQGPLINIAAVNKVDSLVTAAVAAGAKVVTGGRRASGAGANFYEPTVLIDVEDHMHGSLLILLDHFSRIWTISRGFLGPTESTPRDARSTSCPCVLDAD